MVNINTTRKLGWLISAAALVLAGFAPGGCASETEYLDIQQQTEMARAEIEKTQAESNALDEQLKALEAEVAALSSRSQELSDEIQRLEASQRKEQSMLDETLGKLHNEAIAMTGQVRTLRHDYDAEQKAGIMLASLVQRYAKELEASEEAPAPAPMPVTSGAQPNPPALAVTASPPAPAAPTVSSVPPAPPVQPTVTVHPSKPAATTTINPPVEEVGWFASVLNWILAIWHLIF
jgi:hypothetical protein